ncbi:hypothetical protein ACFLRC_01360 [Candidatus Altiarchaeota archaeon]
MVFRDIGYSIVHETTKRFVRYDNIFLDFWGIWDSVWYLEIAANGYPSLLNSVAVIRQPPYLNEFFPLYPLLIRAFHWFIGDYFLAGVIISNICLLVACIYLYRLVSLQYDKDTAMKSVVYFFLFPSSFILSAVLSESLALALIIMCFYYAKKEEWAKTGFIGIFLSLTRPIGALIVIPLLYDYLKTRKSRLNFKWAYLLMFPLGIFLYLSYTYHSLVGFFLYFSGMGSGWGHSLSNPIISIFSSMSSGSVFYVFNGLFVTITLLFLLRFYKKIATSYLLLSLLLILGPLSFSGPNTMLSVTRYTILAFPIFIQLARIPKRVFIEDMTYIVLFSFQIILMACWSGGSGLIL